MSADAIAWAREQRRPLRREMAAATARLDAPAAAVLRALGLPVAALCAEGLVGMVEAQTNARDLWQPVEGGRPLIVAPVVEGAAVTDLVGFDPLDPDLWFLRTGEGWALGQEAIAHAAGGWPGAAPLRLHSRPLDWLLAGGTGACVARWCEEARRTLRGLPAIEVACAPVARILEAELSRPARLPTIRVAPLRRADAA